MELLCQLDVANTADFFVTFFRLPARYWRGFLASRLSSLDLVGFALATFALAPFNIQVRCKIEFLKSCRHQGVHVGSALRGCALARARPAIGFRVPGGVAPCWLPRVD